MRYREGDEHEHSPHIVKKPHCENTHHFCFPAVFLQPSITAAALNNITRRPRRALRTGFTSRRPTPGRALLSLISEFLTFLNESNS